LTENIFEFSQRYCRLWRLSKVWLMVSASRSGWSGLNETVWVCLVPHLLMLSTTLLETSKAAVVVDRMASDGSGRLDLLKVVMMAMNVGVLMQSACAG